MADRAQKVPPWLNALLIGGTFAALVWAERRRPLRRKVESKSRHEARNLAIATLAHATVQTVERPIVEPLSDLVHRRRGGLVHLVRLPAWLEILVAVMLMDYTLYLWHILTHRVPFLWRFHQPHHVDLDMTASTALRFHFGELALAVLWRAGQVRLIGASPLALSLWQMLTLVEIMFHHSNVQLRPETERWLSRIVVTPRLHGIHHSVIEEETNSNWSSGLTLWDWLHGTLRLDVPQEEITIGVAAYRDPDEVTLPRVVAMPFHRQRDPWRLPDGTRPVRPALPPPACGPLQSHRTCRSAGEARDAGEHR